VAERAVEVASTNHQVEASRMAAEKAEDLQSQVEVVAKTVEDRGTWSGPNATVQPRQTPDLPIIGHDEEEAFRRHSADGRQEEAVEALSDLPDHDPLQDTPSLDVDPEDVPSPEDAREADIRDRLENPSVTRA
jgi:hypothetical protein